MVCFSWCLGVKLLGAKEKTDLWCGYGRERERPKYITVWVILQACNLGCMFLWRSEKVISCSRLITQKTYIHHR